MGMNSGRTRVLVVEDEQDIAGLIKHALEREGAMEVDVAGSGDAALKSVTEDPPDLVILDLNLPVLSGDGALVGRIGEISYTQSQVVLLGDPDCRVSVMIEQTRENGVIAPVSSSPLDNTIIDLSYLSRNSKLAPGQHVITSGVGGIFPKGIAVGQIVDWKSVGYGLYVEARVKVQVNMNALEEVWVKMQ